MDAVNIIIFHNLLLAGLAVPNGALLFGVLSVWKENKLHIWFPTTVLNMPYNFSAKLAISIIFKYNNKNIIKIIFIVMSWPNFQLLAKLSFYFVKL